MHDEECPLRTDTADGDRARARVLAELLSCSLVTADRRLANAPSLSCAVEQLC